MRGSAGHGDQHRHDGQRGRRPPRSYRTDHSGHQHRGLCDGHQHGQPADRRSVRGEFDGTDHHDPDRGDHQQHQEHRPPHRGIDLSHARHPVGGLRPQLLVQGARRPTHRGPQPCAPRRLPGLRHLHVPHRPLGLTRIQTRHDAPPASAWGTARETTPVRGGSGCSPPAALFVVPERGPAHQQGQGEHREPEQPGDHPADAVGHGVQTRQRLTGDQQRARRDDDHRCLVPEEDGHRRQVHQRHRRPRGGPAQRPAQGPEQQQGRPALRQAEGDGGEARWVQVGDPAARNADHGGRIARPQHE